jgi:HEAT repeat protein
MRALDEALAAGTPEFQEFIAEALGQSTNMASGIILDGLLKNANETVALSAIRSLSKHGSPFAVASLSQLLYDDGRSLNVRAEAALGLGAIARPDALAELATAVMQIRDEAVASQIVRGIASRPLNETQPFLQAFLDAPQVSAELKTEALEGLSEAQGDATPLLLNYLQSNDPELRAAAALALSTSETRGAAGAEIIALLKDETDPLVRKRLYRALANQENFDFNAAWARTANETDPAARIAGMDVLARAAQQSPSPHLTALFDEYALPELKNLALNGGTRDAQLASVIVLRRLQTASAAAALRDIAARTSDTGIATATGIPAPRPRQ